MVNQQQIEEREENLWAGIAGAFLFSLAGAAVWILLSMIGFIAAISGAIGVICAIQGYRIFGKKLTKRGVIISAVIALIVLVIAWYGCMAYDYWQATATWLERGEIDVRPTFGWCFANAYLVLQEPELARAYLGNLGLGLLFAVIGAARYVIVAFKSAGTEATVPPAGVVTTIPQPKDDGETPKSGEYENKNDNE